MCREYGADDEGLAREAARRVGKLGGLQASDVRRLGVDHTLAASSRHQVFSSRLKACSLRWRRVTRLIQEAAHKGLEGRNDAISGVWS